LSEDDQEFVGYALKEVETRILAMKVPDESGTYGLLLEKNPFYMEAGGQVSDHGTVESDSWSMEVVEVRKVQGMTAVFGAVKGDAPPVDIRDPLLARARVADAERHDTERNHTATHLLHAALRAVLGEHVVQRGSLVAPDRLRFDFAHTAPMTEGEKAEVERIVNDGVWADHAVEVKHMAHSEALGKGAMALFGEKYGDEVRVIEVPGVSMELCGGTHCRHTGEIGLFKIVSETGVAAGVRRIEALTGPGAFRHFRDMEERLEEMAVTLKARPDAAPRRLTQVLKEKEELEGLLSDLRKGGGGSGETVVSEKTIESSGGRVEYRGLRLKAQNAGDVREWGDGYRTGGKGRVAVVAAELGQGKFTLFVFVSDDLISRGIRADSIVRDVAEHVGGKGGGKPHMAQAGVGDPSALDGALEAGSGILEGLIEKQG